MMCPCEQVCLLTNPIWVIKTRLQLQRVSSLKAAAPRMARRAAGAAGPSPYRNLSHAIKQIAKEEGLGGFYRGLVPSLLLVCAHLEDSLIPDIPVLVFPLLFPPHRKALVLCAFQVPSLLARLRSQRYDRWYL